MKNSKAISGTELVERILGGPNVDHLLATFNNKEHAVLEFKASWKPWEGDTASEDDCRWNVIKAIIAMANASGGCIILGIAENKSAVEGKGNSKLLAGEYDPDGILEDPKREEKDLIAHTLSELFKGDGFFSVKTNSGRQERLKVEHQDDLRALVEPVEVCDCKTISEKVLVFIVHPCKDTNFIFVNLLPESRTSNSAPKQVLFYRDSDLPATHCIVDDMEQVAKYCSRRKIEQMKYTRILNVAEGKPKRLCIMLACLAFFVLLAAIALVGVKKYNDHKAEIERQATATEEAQKKAEEEHQRAEQKEREAEKAQRKADNAVVLFYKSWSTEEQRLWEYYGLKTKTESVNKRFENVRRLQIPYVVKKLTNDRKEVLNLVRNALDDQQRKKSDNLRLGSYIDFCLKDYSESCIRACNGLVVDGREYEKELQNLYGKYKANIENCFEVISNDTKAAITPQTASCPMPTSRFPEQIFEEDKERIEKTSEAIALRIMQLSSMGKAMNDMESLLEKNPGTDNWQKTDVSKLQDELAPFVSGVLTTIVDELQRDAVKHVTNAAEEAREAYLKASEELVEATKKPE